MDYGDRSDRVRAAFADYTTFRAVMALESIDASLYAIWWLLFLMYLLGLATFLWPKDEA
jgi:hypothetical protein